MGKTININIKNNIIGDTILLRIKPTLNHKKFGILKILGFIKPKIRKNKKIEIKYTLNDPNLTKTYRKIIKKIIEKVNAKFLLLGIL